MTFGQQVDAVEALDMLSLFLESGHRKIDSAFVYNDGETEKILGQILHQFKRSEYEIATKANPRITGRLDVEAIRLQLLGSLESMQLDYVDIFYLHMPDYNTPIKHSLEACAELHAQGKFKKFGISNYPSWMLCEIWHICNQEGWPKPEIYQGLYNALSRNIEHELIPAARYLGVSLYAFNPLAGGILTGKYKETSKLPKEGRFALRKSYQNRYWSEKMLDAANIMSKLAHESGLSPAEAALSWLANSSLLDYSKGDSIMLGASSISQLSQNLEHLKIRDLPDELQKRFQDIWQTVKSDSPKYFKTK